MSRLSFEKKRAQQPVAHAATVHVRVSGTGTASVGGTAVQAAPGEDVRQAVLNHLQRLAISIGAPVVATVHDESVGCVVPLEVSTDGSSRVAGEPARLGPGTRAAVRAAVPPRTVQVPTGRFGPAPAMGSAVETPSPAPSTAPAPAIASAPAPVPTKSPVAVPEAVAPLPDPEAGFASAHTRARGFDAVAEEVLGDGPVTETAEGAELLTEPMTRINEAVRTGRIGTAAELADRTVAEATGVLGPRHPEVLHLRELTAYIAYLAGEPVRACRLSLDLARLRRRAQDSDAAYGNVQSAATAWRAVRDPEEGLRLGRDLIDLWTDLMAEPGPAADDPRPLECARARMVRLTDRAAGAAAQA
ncbi:hypothetical protein [Streptomyces sp. NK08204]|uniref:hypothetical protein n=1 Tax=Streptomyces sp. NK08204 TaxID=2873260 RepID=UPI001CEDAC83|nr:hypothetical protein [Streptomyces sp. NK08204]